MTTYRLFPATSGPASAVNYSGNFISGVVFAVAGGGLWFEGYWWWVCATGQSTSPVKCALWSPTSGTTGVIITGSVVTSGALTAGQWNYIPLAEPVQLAPSLDSASSIISSAYIAAIGCNGSFPDTTAFWSAPVAEGPLTAFSGAGGPAPAPYNIPQGCFTTASADPAASMPESSSGTDNFWVDVSVSTTTPVDYTGSYRLWPDKADANPATSLDDAVAYVVATEFSLSQSCVLDNIWYYSSAGAASLATWAGVYSVTGADSGVLKAVVTSPSWSGVAGSGWVKTAVADSTLPAGNYKVAVYNSAGASGGWSPKDASSSYWVTGAGSGGITWGPVSAPDVSAASAAYEYDAAGAGNTPAYSTADGSTEPGQATFAITGPQYPYLYVDELAQNYWVDAEVTPVAQGGVVFSAHSARTRWSAITARVN